MRRLLLFVDLVSSGLHQLDFLPLFNFPEVLWIIYRFRRFQRNQLHIRTSLRDDARVDRQHLVYSRRFLQVLCQNLRPVYFLNGLASYIPSFLNSRQTDDEYEVAVTILWHFTRPVESLSAVKYEPLDYSTKIGIKVSPFSKRTWMFITPTFIPSLAYKFTFKFKDWVLFLWLFARLLADNLVDLHRHLDCVRQELP